MHIKPKSIQTPSVEGEFDITDYSLGFDEQGPLRHLNVHWDAIVHFCKTLDAAQDKAKQTIARGLSGVSPDDPEACFFLARELECATLADETLTKATIFIVLCSFKEFALKELYYQLKDVAELTPKYAYGHIQKIFREKELWPDSRESNKEFSGRAYESVRNKFAHGDWADLRKELPNLELHDEFVEVMGFLSEIRDGMRSQELKL